MLLLIMNMKLLLSVVECRVENVFVKQFIIFTIPLLT